MVITMHDDPDLLQEALAAGADAFVTKSNLYDALLPLLEKWFRGIACNPARGP